MWVHKARRERELSPPRFYCVCSKERKDRKGRGKKMKMRWRFQTRREIHRSIQTYATSCGITELCTCSLRRSVSRPAFTQTSAPVSPFSRLGLPRLVFVREWARKKNEFALACIRAKLKQTVSFQIRAVLLKTNFIAYLF